MKKMKNQTEDLPFPDDPVDPMPHLPKPPVELPSPAPQGPQGPQIPDWGGGPHSPPPVGYYREGTGGSDTLYGSDFADDIYGLAGSDTLYGGLGNDHLYGGRHNDNLVGGAGADLLDGGEGFDKVSYESSSHPVTVDLTGGAGFRGDAEGDTYVGIEGVVGSNGDDVIIGHAGDNVLFGGGGNDQIVGGAGQDTLIGGAGFDTLTGDMAGIRAADMFEFTRNGGGARITDLQHGLDHIMLMDFGGNAALGKDGKLAWGDGENNNALSAGDTLYFHTETNTLYQIEVKLDNNGHVDRFFYKSEVVTVTEDVGRLTENDFFIF